MNLLVVFLLSLLEGSLFSFPFVFLFLLFLLLLSKNSLVFPLSFLGGIFLDVFAFRTIGLTSAFFLIFLFAVYQYGRKFEIKSTLFIVLSAFIGSFVYLSLFQSGFILQKALFTAFAAFLISKFVIKKEIVEW